MERVLFIMYDHLRMLTILCIHICFGVNYIKCNTPILTPRMYWLDIYVNVGKMRCMIPSVELKVKAFLDNSQACKGKYFIYFMLWTMF